MMIRTEFYLKEAKTDFLNLIQEVWDQSFNASFIMNKYYAYYEGASDWMLMTAREYEENLAIPENHDYFRVNLEGFKTLREAKDYLLYRLRCDLDECKSGIISVKAWRAK